MRELLSRSSPSKAKYLIKIMTGDLRIGLKESLVEEAIARAYGGTLREVQRANMLLGDIGETLLLAPQGNWRKPICGCFIHWDSCWPVRRRLPKMRWPTFRTPGWKTNTTAFAPRYTFRRDEVRIFSRTRDDITESFPNCRSN